MKRNTVPMERIRQAILFVRGSKVMLDRDLAILYGVETRVLNQAVKRNRDRFPDDFMFELTREEIRNISQSVICSSTMKHAKNVYAFTEQGVAMLSTVLNSPRAIQVNIAIMRTFVQLRTILSTMPILPESWRSWRKSMTRSSVLSSMRSGSSWHLRSRRASRLDFEYGKSGRNMESKM